MSKSSRMQVIQGLSWIHKEYEGYLIDLWGVVHNGEAPYPGVLEALSFLVHHQKTVVLLSNSPRRVDVVRQRLLSMGLTQQHFTGIYTSGEDTHSFLQEWIKAHGFSTFYHIGTRKDESLYSSLLLTKSNVVQKAHFILCSDACGWRCDLDELEELLQEALQACIPMVCANSDLVVRYQDQLFLCAGSIAKRYEALGGDVLYFGKPHAGVYDYVLKNFQMNPSKSLAIGDSLLTDIKGALSQKMDAVLVAGGVHLNDLGLSSWGQEPSVKASLKLCEKYDVYPRYLLSHFKL